MRLLARLLLMLMVVPALAQTALPQQPAAPNAQMLFVRGDFAAAAIAARALGTAEGDALAARATLTRAAYQTSSRKMADALIDAALVDARRGQARDATQLGPLLQEGVALGYRAKLQQSPKIARQARALFERAVALEPGNAVARMSLGAWNGEPIADIGAFLARVALGATQEQAIRHYELALALDPHSPEVLIFYAFNLYRIDAAKYGTRARTLLEAAVRLPAQDGFQALLLKNARDVLAAMQAGDPRAVSRLVRLRQPFGAILVKK